jgi:hypothetical protein
MSAKKAEKSRGSFLGLGTAVAAVFTTGALVSFTNVIARFESLENSLNVVFGSAERGRAVFEDINELAGITPFSVDALTESVIKLRAAGIEPSVAQLTLFSDVASVTTDRVGSLQAITDLFSRTTAGGLGLEDLNRLADRGIPVFTILQERLGLARLEVSELGKTAEGANQILEALTQGLQERFGGASKEAASTLEVSISNLGIAFDNFLLAIGRAGALDILTSAVTGLTGALDFLGDNLGTVAVAASGLATLVIPKLVAAVRLLTLAIAANPIGIFIVALTTAATAVFYFRGVIFDFLIKTFEVSIPNAIDYAIIGMLKFGKAIRDVVNVVLRQINRLGNHLIANTPDFLKDMLGISGEPFRLNIDNAGIEKQIDTLFDRISERTRLFKPPPRPDFLGLDDGDDEGEPKKKGDGLSDSGSLTGDRIGEQQESITQVVLDKERERASRRLEIVENSLLTEEERLRDSYFNRQFIVEEAFENDIISEERRQEILIGLAQKYETDRLKLEKKGWSERQKFAALSAKAQTQTVLGELLNLTAGVAQSNRQLFELNKASGIANAIINTYEGVSETLSKYPQPLAGVLAATHLAAGLATVDAIRSTPFTGGGGTAPSGITGGPTAPSAELIEPIETEDIGTAGQQRGNQITVNIEGSVFSGDDFREAVTEAFEIANANDEVIIRAN